MIEWKSNTVWNEYEVQVGLMKVVVISTTQDDAIAAARQRLGRELPRMYDVIYKLAPDRFSVVCRSVVAPTNPES